MLSAQLTRDAVERDGSDVNLLINAGVAMAEECIGQLQYVEAGLFLGSADEDQLPKLAFDTYGIVKKPAAPALGTAVFRTLAANPSTFTIPANTVLQTGDGTQYLTLIATSFAAGSTGPLFVPIRSQLAGADQQAKIGTITNIVTGIAGAPSDLQVTNELATAGAADEESPKELTDRCRRFFLSVRKGTTGAIEAQALGVPGVVRATAIEALDTSGRAARIVQLVVSDAFTDALAALNLTDPTYQTQSQTLAQQVFAALSDVRAGGIFVHVIVGQVVLLPITLSLTFAAGVPTDTTALAARARIVNFVNELSPGVAFDRTKALEALRAVNGLIITGNEIANPAGNVVPRSVQVLRTSLGLVNATAVQTDQPVALTTNPDQFLFQNLPVPVS